MSIPNDPRPFPLELQDILKEMQSRTYRLLLERVRDGSATHQELAIVAKLLKDNGLVMPPRDPDEVRADADRVLPSLPEFDGETEE